MLLRRRLNPGVKKEGVWACTLGQVVEHQELSGESGFHWPEEIPNRQSDILDRQTVWNRLYKMSKRIVSQTTKVSTTPWRVSRLTSERGGSSCPRVLKREDSPMRLSPEERAGSAAA